MPKEETTVEKSQTTPRKRTALIKKHFPRDTPAESSSTKSAAIKIKLRRPKIKEEHSTEPASEIEKTLPVAPSDGAGDSNFARDRNSGAGTGSIGTRERSSSTGSGGTGTRERTGADGTRARTSFGDSRGPVRTGNHTGTKPDYSRQGNRPSNSPAVNRGQSRNPSPNRDGQSTFGPRTGSGDQRTTRGPSQYRPDVKGVKLDKRGIPIQDAGASTESAKATRSGSGESGARKSFKATKKKQFVNKRKQFEEKKINYSKKKNQVILANPVPKSISIMENISIADLAKKMNLKASELISKLMAMGMMANQNSMIDSETAQLLASEYSCEINVISLYEQTLISAPEENEDDIETRSPVVTIMGHVDHGKTTLLDTIRKSKVVEGEQGNITQHIGAYMVKTDRGSITFLDTPGHEAFSLMRSRGAKITDIIILVVAADDGLKPQSIEAISHAKESNVPVIVALNKIDKPSINIDRILQQLTEQGLVAEEWAGDTPMCRISALKNEGIDNLLEHIILQAEVMDIKSNTKIPAQGVVLESRIEHGKGVVATLLIQKGCLKKGDNFVVGIHSGKVREIYNDFGKTIPMATPSMPVEIVGLDGMPSAGDPFQVTDNDKEAKQVSIKRQELMRHKEGESVKKITVDNLYETIEVENTNTFKIIIKGDVHGSVEAIKEALEKISHDEIIVKVIHASAGTINAADILLASTSNAMVIGFNVGPSQQVQKLANQEKVSIQKFSVIFDVIESIRNQVESKLAPEYKEEKIGEAEVREIFSVPKFGVIAGSYMHSGKIEKSSIVKVMRQGKEIFSGKVSSLKRFKDDVNKVEKGFECGIGVEGTDDIIIEDILMIYKEVLVQRKLS